MTIEPIVKYLENLGFGEVGVSIFAHYMPSDVDVGILVIQSGLRTEIDPYIKGQRHGKFQVVVRHNGYSECTDVAHEVVERLQVSRMDVEGVFFHQIRATHEPLPFPPSDGNKVESSINFQAVYVSEFNY